ncbi:hypothetical protein [Caproiciproducens sp. MSJ-32]|uniref:hypothetical protein n=1 Tax=Caproiciproducens sp. MSJ-32 TaxID=2841527 RepID=UPI001C116725|nr:hypothetical protein [Caproiciproducens sp. MSJ-32]MBU5454765.1 hypothetical protein [Caproiciproducens sp. MSJ-32]
MTRNSKSKSIYPPKMRTGYRPKKSALRSYGKDKRNGSILPSPVTDDIVVNNISYSEFDYIYDPIYESQFDDLDDSYRDDW